LLKHETHALRRELKREVLGNAALDGAQEPLQTLVLGIGIDTATPSGSTPPDPLPLRIERFEAGLIRDALRSTRGDVKSCLEILRIPRKTFYDKVARHGIDLDTFRRPSP
jgi:two-component system C4-dicarboxylate transport response regulator DctD